MKDKFYSCRAYLRALLIGLCMAISVLASTSQAALVFRFADVSTDGGKYAGDSTASRLPSVELNNVSSYELAFIAPIKAPYHLYLRYNSVSADDGAAYVTGLPPLTTVLASAATVFDKDTYDIGIYWSADWFTLQHESVAALRYDDISHTITGSSLVSASSKAEHQQALWGLHIADRAIFALHEQWQLSAGLGVNLMFGDRESKYQHLSLSTKDSDSGPWLGMDAELALMFLPTAVLNIKAGYSYSIMWDYLRQDLYAPAANISASNSGEADYIEQGPFIELLINF